jgi:hypothetical protein
MSYRTNTDNIYPVGSHITSRADVNVKLVIRKYYQRIYYCTVLDNEAGKQLVYFEHELSPLT